MAADRSPGGGIARRQGLRGKREGIGSRSRQTDVELAQRTARDRAAGAGLAGRRGGLP